jgi:hypothetical protein
LALADAVNTAVAIVPILLIAVSVSSSAMRLSDESEEAHAIIELLEASSVRVRL